MIARVAVAAVGAAVALFSQGCGPKCEPPTGIDICTSPEPSCVPEAPQICPRTNPIPFCDRMVGGGDPGGPFPGAYAYTLTVDNYGEEPLMIEDIRVVGDDRCALKGIEWSPMGEPVLSLQSYSIIMYYDPPDVGDDELFIEIVSNAENFPVFPLNVCGSGVTGAPAVCIFCDETWVEGMPPSMCP